MKQTKKSNEIPPELAWMAAMNQVNNPGQTWNPFSKKTMWKWAALVIWLLVSIIWGTISILASIIDTLGGLL
jgi:hypothetical protein